MLLAVAPLKVYLKELTPKFISVCAIGSKNEDNVIDSFELISALSFL